MKKIVKSCFLCIGFLWLLGVIGGFFSGYVYEQVDGGYRVGATFIDIFIFMLLAVPGFICIVVGMKKNKEQEQSSDSFTV